MLEFIKAKYFGLLSRPFSIATKQDTIWIITEFGKGKYGYLYAWDQTK